MNIFESRGQVLASEAQERVLDKQIELAKLEAENEALRRDAERYRAIRNSGHVAASGTGDGFALPMYQMNENHRAELDRMADKVAAMGETKC